LFILLCQFWIFFPRRCLRNMELAICKTDLSATKFMLPPSLPTSAAIGSSSSAVSATASHFLDKAAHELFQLNAINGHLFKSPASGHLNSVGNPSILSQLNGINNSSSHSGQVSTMRLKKNRKVTFLSSLVEVSKGILEIRLNCLLGVGIFITTIEWANTHVVG